MHLPSVQDFSVSSSRLMEHTALDPDSHGTEPAPLYAQPACETISAPVIMHLPSVDIQDFSVSSSRLMEHTALDIRHKLLQSPDIIDASSDSNMSAVFEVQASTVSSASVHGKKKPTYKQPIDLDSETDPPTHQRTCKRIRNQETQNDDADEETDDEVHATKRVCIRKIKWTEEEVSTIKTAFGHLLMKGILPGYSQIEGLQDKKRCLQRQSKEQIKSKCHQLINKKY